MEDDKRTKRNKELS